MSENNPKPDFKLPFYRYEERAFFRFMGGKVWFPSINTGFDFTEEDESESGRRRFRP